MLKYCFQQNFRRMAGGRPTAQCQMPSNLQRQLLRNIKHGIPADLIGVRLFGEMTRQRISVYSGSFVHATDLKKLEYVEKAHVGVDANGTIVFIDKDSENGSKAAEKAGYNGQEVDVVESDANGFEFFFPGFFDTHIHAPQYANAGIFGYSTLLDWLQQYTFPLEASLSDAKRAKDCYSKVISKTLSNGTTTASYFATLHADPTKVLADEALKQNQRAFIGRACMIENSPDYYRHHSHEESHAADHEVIEHIKKIDPEYEIVSPIVTPRFAPSCDDDMLKWLGALAKSENLPIQTHISEHQNEVEWVKELYPQYNGYADTYDKTGLLTDKTILAHAVHLTEDEQKVIKLRESGISHCPISNSSLTSGEAPIRKYLDKNIKVSLGTDVAGGYSPSILEVARQACLVSRHIAMKSGDDRDKLTIDEVLAIATLGGAQVCNLQDKVGNFQVGKKFDAQLVSFNAEESNVDLFPWNAGADASIKEKLDYTLQKWLYCGDDRNTRKVWVNGQLSVSK